MDTLLESAAFRAEMQRQQSNQSAAAEAATPSLLDAIRARLPRLSDTGNQLRFGRHVTVSSDGDEAIELVRKLASGPRPQARTALLDRLQTLASNRCPEALNILSFMQETGSFGYQSDLARAKQLYQAAAQADYQPALYNLALLAAYGRGMASDTRTALSLLEQAHARGLEISYRVCGMGALLAYRQGDSQAAARYSQHCASPLSHLYKSTIDNSADTLNKRVELLRDFLATGANDAYALLVAITRPHADQDPGQLYCKYLLLDRFHDRSDLQGLQEQAQQCVQEHGGTAYSAATARRPGAAQGLAGVAGFVPSELAHIQAQRRSNRFHFSWPVPYLPFAQQEVDIFAPALGKPGP